MKEEIKVSTKNIDKIIRTIERAKCGLRVDNSYFCNLCHKKIRKNQKWIALINGFGGLNYYHINCFL